MQLIDLDQVDWSKLPLDFMQYTSVEAVKNFLKNQPTVTAFVLTRSQNPVVKAKGFEAAMDLNRFVIDLTNLLVLANTENGGKNSAQQP